LGAGGLSWSTQSLVRGGHFKTRCSCDADENCGIVLGLTAAPQDQLLSARDKSPAGSPLRPARL
jgi:hypothetical protein